MQTTIVDGGEPSVVEAGDGQLPFEERDAERAAVGKIDDPAHRMPEAGEHVRQLGLAEWCRRPHRRHAAAAARSSRDSYQVPLLTHPIGRSHRSAVTVSCPSLTSIGSLSIDSTLTWATRPTASSP